MTPMRRRLARFAARLYRAYHATLRVRVVRPDGAVVPPASWDVGVDVLALCERDVLAVGRFAGERAFVSLVATGRDGDWAAEMLDAVGCRAVRGSSRHGATDALVALLDAASASPSPLGIVVDGPLGPAGVARPGAIVCGLRTGRPVRAIGAAARWRIRFPRTWSGIYLPLPFSVVAIAFDAPLAMDGGDVERHTRDLTERLAIQAARARDAVRSRGEGFRSAVRALRSALVLLRDGFVAALLLPALAPLWMLPWRAALALGCWYGYAACAAWPLGRRVGMINLRRAYGPSLTQASARRAVWTVFGSLGQSIAEGVQFARRFRHAGDRWRSLYECEDLDLERRILDDPRPKILVMGHLGSWELAGALAALRIGRVGAMIGRRVDNPFLDALWRRIRARYGGEWIEKRGAAHEALRRLRGGQSVAMLLDEHGGPRGVFVPFFGVPASTRKTPAVLSLATGAPVIVGACVRRPRQPFLYRLASLEPDRRLGTDEAIADLTARIVSTYEGWIREAPLQWRWIHWRWKARPDGAEERYGRVELAEAFAVTRDAACADGRLGLPS